MRLYLSAAAPGPDWRLGLVEFKFTDLLARLEGANLAAHRAGSVQRPEPLVEEGSLP
jgi:hypothetical protein